MVMKGLNDDELADFVALTEHKVITTLNPELNMTLLILCLPFPSCLVATGHSFH